MRRPVFLVVVLACLLCAAPAAAQDGAARLATDCQDDRIDGTYTQAEFREGLRALATDVDEYSACRDVIRQAQLRAAAAASAGKAGDASARPAATPRAAAAAGGTGAGAVAGARASGTVGTAASGAPGADPAAQDARGDAGAKDPAPAAPLPADPTATPPGPSAAVAGEQDAVGAAVDGVGRAATPAVTPPATARVLGGLGALLLAGLAASVWMARRGQA